MRSNVILDPYTQLIYEETPAPAIKYLIFEGGGIRGLAYSRLVEALNDVGMLEEIEHVGGSSIGAIAALLVALGCIPDEIKEILDKLPFKNFLEGKDPSLLQFFIAVLIKRKFSLSSGAKLKEWVEELLEKKLGNRHATFADLAAKVEETKDKGRIFKYLSVVISNITKNRLEVCNHETKPQMCIADAIVCSASYPGVFQTVEWNGDLYLDGGLMANLPSFLFNDRRYLPPGYDFNDKGANPAVLHIKVDTLDEMGMLYNKYNKKFLKTIYEYCTAVLYGMQSRDAEISDQIPTNVLQIYDCDIGTFNVSLSVEEKLRLLDSGKEGTLEWLYHHCDEALEVKPPFNNEAEWLASKSVNEIAAIKQYYIDQLEKLIRKTDADKTEITALQNKITSLTDYITISAHNLNFPDQAKPLPVTPHINIYANKPRKKVDQKIKAIAQARLKLLQDKLNALQTLINETKLSIHQSTGRLHEHSGFDQVVYLNALQEELKLFHSVKRCFQRILNLPLSPLPPRSNYHEFQNGIRKFLAKKTAAWSCHYALLQRIDLDLAQMQIGIKEKNDVLTLDLRNEEDFKTYIMACYLYLQFIDCTSSEIHKRITELYQQLFQTTLPPKNIDELGQLFQRNATDSLTLAYRTENLIQYFACIDRPKESMKFKLVNIDDVFGKLMNPKWDLPAIFAKNQAAQAKMEKDNGIEMSFIYKPFTCTEKFLMFHNVVSNDDKSNKSCFSQSDNNVNRML